MPKKLVDGAVLDVPGDYTEIEYMMRRIAATSAGGADPKSEVKAEVAKMFADGWKLFATHYGGDKGNGVILLHVFVR